MKGKRSEAGIMRGALITLIALALVVVGVRLYLPHYLLGYVNSVLNRMPDYEGRVDHIDVALYRGAYRLVDVKLLKRSGKVNIPFLAVPAIDLSVEWRALFHAAFVGEIEMEQPVMNIINSGNPDQRQAVMKRDWVDAVKALFPITINRFAVTDGTLTYRHRGPHDDVAVTINAFNGEAKNLSNVNEENGLPSTVAASGLVENEAPVKLKMRLYPLVRPANFSGDLIVENLPLKRINRLLRRTIGADAEDGTLSVYAEAEAKNNYFKGYIKPIAKQVSLVSVDEVSEKPLITLWEGLVQATVEFFTNHRHDQFAGEIPFSGSIDNPQADIFATIGSVLSNAFIEAIPAALEHRREQQ